MSDSEWYSAKCPTCGADARWQAVRNDGNGPPKLTIICKMCCPLLDDADALAEVLKGDAA